MCRVNNIFVYFIRSLDILTINQKMHFVVVLKSQLFSNTLFYQFISRILSSPFTQQVLCIKCSLVLLFYHCPDSYVVTVEGSTERNPPQFLSPHTCASSPNISALSEVVRNPSEASVRSHSSLDSGYQGCSRHDNQSHGKTVASACKCCLSCLQSSQVVTVFQGVQIRCSDACCRLSLSLSGFGYYICMAFIRFNIICKTFI